MSATVVAKPVLMVSGGRVLMYNGGTVITPVGEIERDCPKSATMGWSVFENKTFDGLMSKCT
jgi:hypothetical protein